MIPENKGLFDLLGITPYHEQGRTGQGRTVVVLDSDSQGNHQGQICREGAEIAPSCRAVYLSRYRDDMKASVDWIFEHKDEIHAINCSWNSMPNPEFERLEALDIPVIAASGNQSDDEINYPGSLPWVISVGAWSEYRQNTETYSNKGEGIDCVAPIVWWMTASGDAPMRNTGTSFAAPVVAFGMQLAEVNGRQAAFDLIRNNAQDKLVAGYDISTGYGLFHLPLPTVRKEDDMIIREKLLTNPANRPKIPNHPDFCCVHWTANESAGADAVANAIYFNNTARQASAHYVVDGKEVILCIPENEVAYSVGATTYTAWARANTTSPNADVISIEMCVNADGDFKKMYANAVTLCASVMNRHKWDITRLIRHHDVTGKNCPAFFVEDAYAKKYLGVTASKAWLDFKAKVKEHLIIGGDSMVGKTVQGEYSVRFQGQTVGKKAIVIDGSTYLPVRALAELGAYKIDSVDNVNKIVNLS